MLQFLKVLKKKSTKSKDGRKKERSGSGLESSRDSRSAPERGKYPKRKKKWWSKDLGMRFPAPARIPKPQVWSRISTYQQNQREPVGWDSGALPRVDG